ncbi:MAG: hypothetical protein ACW99J_20285 [Candidatus Thorarchaeota archaeon]|jgi:hypothetical protein
MPNGDYHEPPLPLDEQVRNLMIEHRARGIKIEEQRTKVEELEEELATLKKAIKLVEGESDGDSQD